jgi:hypothetical protein
VLIQINGTRRNVIPGHALNGCRPRRGTARGSALRQRTRVKIFVSSHRITAYLCTRALSVPCTRRCQLSGGCPISITPPGCNELPTTWHRELTTKSKIMLGIPSAETWFSAIDPRKSRCGAERGSCVARHTRHAISRGRWWRARYGRRKSICSTAIRRAHQREILLTRRSASRKSRMVMSKGIAVPSLPYCRTCSRLTVACPSEPSHGASHFDS